MMPNPMYGGIGIQPGFQSTQGQFGMPLANFGMAGITNQQSYMASPSQLNSDQGTQMNPNNLPMFQSLPYENLTPLEKPNPYKEGGKGVTFTTFTGFDDRKKALSFLRRFDKAYAGGNFTEASKVRKAATYLTGNAGQWWTTLLLQGKAPSTWIYFKQIFASAWLSDEFEADVMTEWHQLNVATCKNLDDFNRKFWKALLPVTSFRLTLAFGKRVGMLVEVQRPILIFPKSLKSLNSNHLIIIMNTLQVTSIDGKNDRSLEGQSAKKLQPHFSSMEVGVNFLLGTSLEGKGDCYSKEGLLSEFIHPAIYNKFHLQLRGVQAIVTSHLCNWQNGWGGPSQFLEFHVAKCFDAEAVFEICALPDEPDLTRFKLHGDIPYLHLTFSSKKWKILKSFFSDDDEENMQCHEDSSIFSSVELENNADRLSDNESPVPYFKLKLTSKSISLFIHSEEENKVHSCIPLLAKGEDASFTFVDSGLQRKLQFFVTTLHIDKALQSDYGPYLSLHSVSNLSLVGLFVPSTIWRWDWKASMVTIVLRGEGLDAEQIVVLSADAIEHAGCWKNGDIESLSCKIMKLTIRSEVCGVDCQSECPSCHLCSANHLRITSAIEQQQNNVILHLAPKEALAGLEISLFSEEKNKNVFISIPLSNVNLHFPKWRIFVRTLCYYRFTDPFDGCAKGKPDVPPTADAQEKEKLGLCPISQNDQSSFIVQTSVIAIDVFFPGYHDFSSGKQISNEEKKFFPYNQIAEVASATSLDKSISAKVTLQVESFCYRESSCNFKASVLKCEVNLKDCIAESYCFPLLQLVSLKVNLDVEHQSAMKKRMIMVHSCTLKRVDIWCSNSTLQFLKSLRFQETPHTESGVGFEAIVTASLQRGSILLTDERWNYSAPIFELRVKTLNSQIRWLSSDQLVCAIAMVLEADFEKVAWEPFLEPWNLSCELSVRFGLNILAQQIDFKLLSHGHLNINLTKPFFQSYLRAVDVFTDATKSPKLSQNKSIVGYAPYWLQNDTGVRLKYWLIGASTVEEADGFSDGNDSGVIVDPGCSIPINIEKQPEQVCHIGRSNSSSERLADKRLYGGRHRMMCVQLEGTSGASCPLSMDLVGAHTFNVPFSYSSSNLLAESKRRKEKFKVEAKTNENGDIEGSNTAFQMPVIYEVSGHYYSKIIRIYSTVSLVNATSIPMEVCFDIPFGVLPKVMEPIFPGEVIPLPVHLAETGQIRWRPMGSSHLWSETQSLSYILSASKLGTLRSFVSYPSNPSNTIFRCCMLVQESRSHTLPISAISEHIFNLSTTSKERSTTASITRSPAKVLSPMSSQASSPITRELVFQAPLVFKNCLPFSLALAIDTSAGHHLSLHVPKCETVFVLEANTGHDLVLTMNVSHFLPASLKIASSTTLLECHKESVQHEITLSETVSFIPDSAHGPVYGKTDILFNMMSGAREISVYVPFWIYNHTGVNLEIADSVDLLRKQDVGEVTQQVIASFPVLENEAGSFETKSYGLQTVLEEPFYSENRVYTHGHFCGTAAMRSVGGGKRIISCIRTQATSTDGDNTKEVQPNMYSPAKDMDLGDSRLRARVTQDFVCPNKSKANWSRPFSLNPPGGMTTIVIPLSEGEGGWVLSVVSAPVLGASAGKTRTITFQPRFVLANICNQDLCFRQQGTDNFEYVLKGKQARLLWSDMSRPLLVSLRFDDHGWDWSGSFVPDQLGDTQIKMRNLITGATQMLRVEVRNAALLENNSQNISSTDNSLGTYLILLSDDESGFMPFRIENFSLERLRFFQSRCPDFESTLLPYSSCLYAWDEPWRPHQLHVEIPGEGCLGTFDLDDVREYPTVHIPATNQKPERWFSVNIHAEGPTRVLSFQDLVLHPRKDLCGISTKGLTTQKIEEYTGCSFAFNCCCSSIGISVIDISPQEILFATAKGVILQLLQSPHEQILNFSVSFIQLDNQLPLAQYPVMVLAGVCLNESTPGKEEGSLGDSSTNFISDQSAFHLSVAKWRRFTSSVDCFRRIHARLAPTQVQLDEQIVSYLIEFFGSSHDMDFHTLYPDDSAQPSILAGSSTMALDRYRLLLDPKSTQLHLLKTLKFESIYRWKKIYIESLSIAPVEVTVSFSSIPWRDRHLSCRQSRTFLRESGPFMQRSLMALFDIEGAPVQLKELSLARPLARWDAIRGMIVRHYTRQLLHEIYKILGSAGFLGNPMGFMKSLGSGVRDFISAPAKSFVQSPSQLVGGFAEGTQSLVNNTVFAVSNAATLMSRVAKKGVTSLALGHQQDPAFQDYGVISELLEGLTGLLQSPVTGAERHGLPGILSEKRALFGTKLGM
ncbi:hypothetical protein L7F22_012747 [Adiantum nelumboides]|nr:hypothetical protein [Adiantum nelumboides]